MVNDGKFQNGSIPWNKGFPCSLETKQKLSIAKKGKTSWNKGISPSEETREKLRNANLDKKTSQETKDKMRLAKLGKNPTIKWNLSDETKAKMGKSREGEKHWRWIEDRTKLSKKQERNDMAYKEWRRLVWTRDNFKCKMHNKNCLGKIEAHHILRWSKYLELRYDVNNGITLCKFHHPRKKIDEENLIPIFNELLNINIINN